MEWIGRAWVLGVATILTVGGVRSVHSLRSLPQLHGTIALKGLRQPVSITRDASDVTHMEAQTALDAWRTLGLVHGQKRGWQLEFNRRVLYGQLGSNRAAVAASLEAGGGV